MNKVLQEEKKNKAFSEPVIEVVRFDLRDVITASGEDNGKNDPYNIRDIYILK